MTLALLAALFVAGLLAWLLSVRRPEHRPVAIVLTSGLTLDVLLRAYDLAVLAPLRDALGLQVPWTGWARAAGVVSDALVIAWPAVLVAAVLVVYLGRKPWPAFAGWAGAVLTLAVAHPPLVVLESVGALVAVAMSVWWWTKTTKPGNSAQLVLAAVTLAEAVSLLGAWRLGPFENWPISQALYLLAMGAVVVTQGRMLCSPRLPAWA